MDKSIYTAMSGAMATLRAQAVNAGNIANIDTTGFRANLDAFKAVPVRGAGLPTRVATADAGRAADFSHGPQIATGRNLDVAVDGDGWIAVQTANGGEAYTRAGDFKVTQSGMLETRAGRPVIGNSGPVAVPPHSKLNIGEDGTISIIPLGGKPNVMAMVDRIKLVDPPRGELEKGPDGLMHVPGGVKVHADADVHVTSGMLEQSNVNAAGALVRMIQLARQFEMQVKIMHAADDNGRASARLLQAS
jgi:flagellar basal-body rod protein FlgF